MNNRQAGAFRETIRREERARELWERQYAAQQQQQGGQTAPMGGTSDNFAASMGGSGGIRQGNMICYPVEGQQGEAAADPYAGAPDPAIYDRAIRISSPRLAESAETDVQPTIQKKVIRQVEVPYTRRVKVPVKTRKIVPTVVQKKVRTKKLVEVPSFKMVNEQYTEIEEVPAVRNKEIWVKKVVPEKYMKKVPVQKSRTVKVPTTVIKEVDDYEIVNVSGSKAVEVDGFRIDEVEDSKLVEVEEYQTYEMRPFATGKAEVVGTREIGPVRGMHHSRRIGNQVFHVQDERVRAIDEDSAPDDTARQSGFGMRNPPEQQAPQQPPISGRRAPRQAFQQQAPPQLGAPQPNQGRVGLKVRDTNANGVVVFLVAPGEPAERAGVKVNDVITYVNNQPTRNLQEFGKVLANSPGRLYMQVRRRGVRKLTLTVQR